MTYGSLLEAFKGVRAVVIGDVMLDAYIFGSATRISPEAPVMVIRETGARAVPGGAANVALNLKALGAQVSLAGVIGDDAEGNQLAEAIRERGVGAHGLVIDASRPTTTKTRVVADHAHQVLRIDRETDAALSDKIGARLSDAARGLIGACDVLVLSDYQKGALGTGVAREAIAMARSQGIPVVANPKPASAAEFTGAHLLSFNRAEANMLTPRFEVSRDNAIEASAELAERLGVETVLITLGEHGMAAAGHHGRWRIDARRVEVYDTAGAGDTVIATVALGFATVGPRAEIFELAAETSARVVRHVGVATPSPTDLAELQAHG